MASKKKTADTGIVTQTFDTFVTWFVGDTAQMCSRLANACPKCGNVAIVELHAKLLAKQRDGTTHVCHPAMGGCNHGFEVTK